MTTKYLCKKLVAVLSWGLVGAITLGVVGGWAPPGVTHADAVVGFEVAENARATSAIAATVIACFSVREPPLGDRSSLPREWNGPVGRGGGRRARRSRATPLFVVGVVST